MSIETITITTNYLTFTLDREVFAVDISKVREVLDSPKITKIPRTPDFMSGVINLRGDVVPVVDLRMKFAMRETEGTIDTCIIIVETQLENENIVFGALADSVQEVIELEPGAIEPAPKIGTGLNPEFITGLGKRGDDFVIILDIDRVLSDAELTSVQESGNQSSVEV